jgi:hypothetical protein
MTTTQGPTITLLNQIREMSRLEILFERELSTLTTATPTNVEHSVRSANVGRTVFPIAAEHTRRAARLANALLETESNRPAINAVEEAFNLCAEAEYLAKAVRLMAVIEFRAEGFATKLQHHLEQLFEEQFFEPTDSDKHQLKLALAAPDGRLSNETTQPPEDKSEEGDDQATANEPDSEGSAS